MQRKILNSLLNLGVRRYVFALTAGLITAKVLKDAKYHREAERDAVLRQYVKLHPEDFPPPGNKQINFSLHFIKVLY